MLVMGFGAGNVLARSWHVEQDGSGDWVRINTAVEAAASGDTILIGPGRYSDMYEITPGGHPDAGGCSLVRSEGLGAYWGGLLIL